jgi:hypothetical protein
MNGMIATSRKALLALCLALVLAFSVPAARPALAHQALTVHILRVGKVLDGGLAVRVHVLAKCTLQGMEVLEAFVYVGQDGHQSNFAGLPVSCGTRPRVQVLTVRVSALDFTFHKGRATASAFVLVVDPVTRQTQSAGDTGPLWLR